MTVQKLKKKKKKKKKKKNINMTTFPISCVQQALYRQPTIREWVFYLYVVYVLKNVC